jgi:tRNA A37 methylthiotransferase MiaB
VARFRARALRNLAARKNEDFRRQMIGQEIDVLTLENGAAISSNFVRVRIPQDAPLNEWIRVHVTGLNEDGLQATVSSTTTAHDTN